MPKWTGNSAFPWAWGLFQPSERSWDRSFLLLRRESGILHLVPGASYVLVASGQVSNFQKKNQTSAEGRSEQQKLQAEKEVRVKWIGWGRPRELRRKPVRSVWCAWTLARMLSSFTGRARCHAEPERNDTRVAGSGMELEIGSGRKLSPVSSKMSGCQGEEVLALVWTVCGTIWRYAESLQGQAGRQACGWRSEGHDGPGCGV